MTVFVKYIRQYFAKSFSIVDDINARSRHICQLLVLKVINFVRKHWLEIISTTMSIVATILCGQKNIACWYVWIAGGGFYLAVYIKKGLTVWAWSMIGWQALNVYCLIQWMAK